MSALFHELAFVKNEDPIAVLDRGQAVGDDQVRYGSQ